MKKRKKTLDDAEKALWEEVKKSTTPLRPSAELTDPIPPSFLKKKMPKKSEIPREEIHTFSVGSKLSSATALNNLAPSVSEQIRQSPIEMDRKKYGKMQRGKLVPEAKIDLHGKTISQAHPALSRFILSSWADGKRLVLVITGKGKHRDVAGPIPVKTGVLKHQVPQWLKMAPLKDAVLQVSEAHLKHGGSGAYYVYLRRRK